MNLIPKEGEAFIEVESSFQRAGAIAVPDHIKARPPQVGTLVSVSLTPEQGENWWDGTQLVGRRVIVSGHAMNPVAGRLYRVKVEEILGIVEDDESKVEVSDRAAPDRCRFCGPARSGSQNNLLLDRGVCPRCGRDKNGTMIRDPRDERIADEAVLSGETPRINEDMAFALQGVARK